MRACPRTRTYELLGELMLGDRRAIERARQMEPLGELLAEKSTSEIAAEHYSLFGLDAFPYAGVYTEKEALVGGRLAARVTELAAAAGIGLRDDESPDHVGNIALLVGRLLRQGDEGSARQVVCSCLVPWLAPWATAVRRSACELWTLVVDLFVELVCDHLGSEVEGCSLALATPFTPHEGTSIGAIAGALTTPAVAGALLTRADIRAIGRQLELPTGFGSRRLMLTNLLRSAAEYHAAPALFSQLAAHYRDRSSAEMPAALLRIGAPWRERAVNTAVCLEEMKSELAGALATVG